MAKPVAEIRLEHGEPLTAEHLAALPIFQGTTAATLEKYPGAVVRRRFRKGEVICREGEFGSTAFYILEGSASVSIRAPIARVETEGGLGGFVRRIRSSLARGRGGVSGEGPARPIPIDAPVDLATDRPVAVLPAGSLFGEMTCLSFYPRSATVVAAEDCTALEMLRNILQLLQKNKVFREKLEADYRARAMDGHLRSVPLLAGLTPGFLDRIRSRVTLTSFEPGQTICRQGEPADAFYLVRIGFVRVTRSFPGGEMVMAYLSRGSAFGEMGLLGEGAREATCTALDHVEVVRIGAEDFQAMVEEFPDIRARLEEASASRRRANQSQAEAMSGRRLDDFLEQGLMQAQNLLVIDLDRCTRCDDCVRACAETHDGVTRLVRDGLRFDRYLVATSCRQCRDPLCMVGCPIGSIRRKESLEIVIEDWCIGCGLCARQCPYGNINMHPFPAPAAQAATGDADAGAGTGHKARVKETRDKATTCDLCSHLPEPSCVTACPHDAAFRVEPHSFFSEQIGPST
ncbi:MAG TPA: cyclic nucleotide-binding domain-containing protein [Candidatus Polarisedimenticolia bacterium]|nr:cyclic nucleotide-binding domain-containing protein [Candidatus Polarisedimenticolia bacterium]